MPAPIAATWKGSAEARDTHVQPAALRGYFARLSGPQAAAVEATDSWYWVSDLLRATNVELHLAHAKYPKATAYAKVKTDAVATG